MKTIKRNVKKYSSNVIITNEALENSAFDIKQFIKGNLEKKMKEKGYLQVRPIKLVSKLNECGCEIEEKYNAYGYFIYVGNKKVRTMEPIHINGSR